MRVRVNFRPTYTIRQALSKVKDRVDTNDRAGVVYTIPCSCGAKYMGETISILAQRLKEHRKTFEYNHPERSAIAKHGLRVGHTPVMDDVNILATTPHRARRWMVEVWHTAKSNSPLMEETVALSQLYTPLLC